MRTSQRFPSPDAVTELMARHQEQLLTRIRKMIGPEIVRRAEDIDFLQDVFLDLARDRSQRRL